MVWWFPFLTKPMRNFCSQRWIGSTSNEIAHFNCKNGPVMILFQVYDASAEWFDGFANRFCRSWLFKSSLEWDTCLPRIRWEYVDVMWDWRLCWATLPWSKWQWPLVRSDSINLIFFLDYVSTQSRTIRIAVAKLSTPNLFSDCGNLRNNYEYATFSCYLLWR